MNIKNFPRIVPILLAMFFLSLVVSAQNTKNDQEANSKKIKASNISSITVTKYNYKFGKPEEEGTKTKYMEFNDDGYMTLEVRYKYGEDEFRKVSFTYNKLEHTNEYLTYDADDNIKKKTVEKYNTSGDITDEIEYGSSGDLKNKITYLYNPSGKLVNKTKYDLKGNMEKFTEYIYDANSNLIEKTTKSDSIHILEMYSYKYDGSNNRIEETEYSSKDNIKEKFVFKYEDKNRIEEIKYGPDGNMEYKVVNKYDASGNKIERTLYASDGQTIAVKINYSYDNHGNLKEEIESDKIGEKKKLTTYEF